jgi:hypothetical protein
MRENSSLTSSYPFTEITRLKPQEVEYTLFALAYGRSGLRTPSQPQEPLYSRILIHDNSLTHLLDEPLRFSLPRLPHRFASEGFARRRAGALRPNAFGGFNRCPPIKFI